MPGDRAPDKRAVMEFLEQFEMPHSSLGYSYLVDAILLVCNGEFENDKRRVMSLYDEIAERRKTTPARVERAIRTMLKQRSCNRTNGQFIFYAADRLRYGFDGG